MSLSVDVLVLVFCLNVCFVLIANISEVSVNQTN